MPAGTNLVAVSAIELSVLDLPVQQAVERVIERGYWLAESDAPTVAMLREAAEDYQRLRSAGAAPKEIREARAEVERLAGSCGFNPRERARLGLAEVKAASKLEQLRKSKGNA